MKKRTSPLRFKTICMRLVLALWTSLCLCGCKGSEGGIDDAAPGVYYWRTNFNLDEPQIQWLEEHHIQKIYLRLFDVVAQNNEAVPKATVAFGKNPPDQYEIIPTIFIDEPALRCSTTTTDLAAKLVQRVAQMGETHHFSFHEWQIDCDWTQRSQDQYFALLTSLRKLLPDKKLSTTIRLHQLSMTAPPADYGVLMLYNTGDFRDAQSTHNPILDVRDVKPYLRYLRHYSLPLCAAYPNFEWNLLYDGNQFAGILYGEDLDDSRSYRHLADNKYMVITSRDIPISRGVVSIHLHPGQTVRHWEVSDSTISTVMQMVANQRPSINKQTITYHLQEQTTNTHETANIITHNKH